MPSDDVRRIEPPRRVQVELDGAWWDGWQNAWVRWPDGTWRADVEFVATYDWGRGKHVMSVVPERVRLASAHTVGGVTDVGRVCQVRDCEASGEVTFIAGVDENRIAVPICQPHADEVQAGSGYAVDRSGPELVVDLVPKE